MEVSFGKLKINKSNVLNGSQRLQQLNSAELFNSDKINDQGKYNLSDKQVKELTKGFVENEEEAPAVATPQISSQQELDEAKAVVAKDMDSALSEEELLALVDDALNINGELDEQVAQQGTGDCYLIATLIAMSGSDAGDKLIQDAISHNEQDHTYTVTFKGVGQSYTFTAQEIADAESKTHVKQGSGVTGDGKGWYSKGDDDVMLIEMAFEQFRKECNDGKFDNMNWPDFVTSTGKYDGTDQDVSPLHSGTMTQFLYVMTGLETTVASGKEAVHNFLDEAKDMGDNNSYAIYASVSAMNGYEESEDGKYYLDDKGKFHTVFKDTVLPEGATRYNFVGAGKRNLDIWLEGVGDSEGKSISISKNMPGNHAIVVTGATDETVTIINPWDSGKEITVRREDFEGYVTDIKYADLSAEQKPVNNEPKKEEVTLPPEKNEPEPVKKPWYSFLLNWFK